MVPIVVRHESAVMCSWCLLQSSTISSYRSLSLICTCTALASTAQILLQLHCCPRFTTVSALRVLCSSHTGRSFRFTPTGVSESAALHHGKLLLVLCALHLHPQRRPGRLCFLFHSCAVSTGVLASFYTHTCSRCIGSPVCDDAIDHTRPFE